MKSKNDITHATRLLPGNDLKKTIGNFAKAHDIKAGWIATCVGSLTEYSIRFANQQVASTGSGHFEILSLSGTVSVHGLHLHITIADGAGPAFGGHLMEGCKIYTTAEVVLIESPNFIFTREKDGSTPWKELRITKK